MFTTFDQHCMQRALELASIARESGEVPVGAVLALDGKIMAEGFNQPIMQHDPTAHAEVIVLRLAAKKLGNYRLINSTLYTTLEPCCMCAGAIVHARVTRVVFATTDPRTGACGSVFNILESSVLNHIAHVDNGLLAEESSALLKQFFQEKRRKK